MTTRPRAIPPSGTFGIIAPSSRGTPDQEGIDILKARGFDVAVHPQNHKALHQSAGTAQERARAVMDVFADTDIDAVMAARGGNRVMHALPFIDFAALAAAPKPLIAFSDGTALINAIYARADMIAYHGPTLSRLNKASPAEVTQMLDAMNGRPQTLAWQDTHAQTGGRASGRLIGGNLSVFAALAGTPYMPDPTGAILFIEDIGDQLSRYDRMLAQLRLSGLLGRLSGLIVGKMLVDGDSSVTPFGFSIDDIIAEHTHGLNIPVLTNAPFGHSGPLCTMPVGSMATLDADNGSLSFE